MGRLIGSIDSRTVPRWCGVSNPQIAVRNSESHAAGPSVNRGVIVRWARWILVVLLCIAASNTSTPAHAHQRPLGTSVIGVDEQDAYVGTGGLLLPGSFSGSISTRRHVAACMGCTWKYTVYCDYGNDSMCAHSVVTCPLGKIRYRVWFGSTPDAVRVIGSVCWGSSHPVTREKAAKEIRGMAMDFVPVLRAQVQPAGGTLTAIPAVFRTSQPRTFKSAIWHLSGQPVQVTAAARWCWQWGDGSSSWVTSPGGTYPDLSVAHRYRSAGTYRAQVATVWTATYMVSGLGPFSVGGDVVKQMDTVEVSVRSARTLLTTWE
jgi:hypothetical protein